MGGTKQATELVSKNTGLLKALKSTTIFEPDLLKLILSWNISQWTRSRVANFDTSLFCFPFQLIKLRTKLVRYADKQVSSGS